MNRVENIVHRGATRPFLRGGRNDLGVDGSPSEAKQTRRGVQVGRAALKKNLELALKL